MDLFQIIDDIAKVDPEVYDRFDSRRAVFRNFLGYGKKASAAAMPLAMSTLFGKAYGQGTSTSSGLAPEIIATLNLALQLEYLERYYYETGVASGILNAEQTQAFNIIINDEKLHIATIKGVLKGDAIDVSTPITRADYDYTGSQNNRRAALFPALGSTFTDVGQFLLVGQQFVDTGVGAYKGGAANLITQKDILETALNIHSVEARHAARIRSFRRGGIQGTGAPKSWIGPDETPATPPLPNNGVPNSPAAVGPYNAGNPAATFPAESNTMQGNPAADVQTLVAGVSATAGAEAFDEPLDAATVKAIAKNFAADPTKLFN